MIRSLGRRLSAYPRRHLVTLIIILSTLALPFSRRLIHLVPSAEAAPSPNVVISQVYGGAGCTTAGCSTYKNDYIELFNRGNSPQALNGWSVQYASATGSSWQVTALTSVTLQPGRYYLIAEGSGANGVNNLPAPDATGSIAMSATAAKVALVNSTTALSGAAPASGSIVDLVGYGTGGSGAGFFEGTGAAPTISTTTSDFRVGGGCTDTDNNSADFVAAAANPRNSSSPANTCTVTNNPPSINTPANPITSVTQGAAPFTVTVTGSDDNNVFNWSATAGTGVQSVSVSGGQGTSSVTYLVTLQSNFSGTAKFTATLSDNVNTAVNQTVNVTVNAAQTNNPPTINPPANPITTVVQDAPAFNVTLTGSDDNSVYNWSATPGVGVANVSVSNAASATATFTVTLIAGFNGTATFSASLSDNFNAPVNRQVNITVNPPPTPATHVVVSQIYGGGGNSNATYRNDYVELYNPTSNSVDLGGWTVQYASSTGTSWQVQPLGGIMQPGDYYLISLASGGANGVPLPDANVAGSINISATTGKIALVNGGDALSDCPIGDPTLVDLVGYGTADCKEGATDAPAPSSTTAIFRNNGGITDTDVNGSDFATGAPNPRRTTPITEIGPYVLSIDPRSNATSVPHDASITVNFTEAVDVDPNWFSINCGTSSQHTDATVAHTSDFRTYIITPNQNFQFGEQCTVTIIQNAVHDQDTDDSAPGTDTLKADYSSTFNVVGAGDPAPYPPSVHLTMGNPSNAVADAVGQPDNYLMMKPTYTLSYNRDKGTPNWVSWHLDSSWYGSLARVDSFRADPAVPPDWYRVEGTDYTASGFDRGHMCPNADRDNENRVPINQETYLMSNMVPQAPDNNQGPWAALESYLRTLTDGGNEIYIVSGPAGQGGTGSNGGVTTTIAGNHVTVPASTWKVALVLPKADGDDVSRVTAATRVIAVVMPNTQGIRNNDWHQYLTTVDAVEQLTGYDFFSNVPTAVQNSIEAGVDGANPPGTADGAVTTAEDTKATFTLNAVSPGGSLTTTVVTQPAHGTISCGGINCTYTPAQDYNGADSFTFSVSDGQRSSNTSKVSILVTESNDAPTATDDAKTTDEDTALVFHASDLTGNDSAGPANESAQKLTVTSVSPTADTHGTVVLDGGQVTYTPAADYNGPASFTYTVCDDGTTDGAPDPKCANASVNVNVNPVNDPPTLSLPGDMTAEATSASGAAVTFNATADDARDGGGSLPVNCTPASGSTFPFGTTTVTCSASDGTLTSSGHFDVRVVDTTAPSLTVPATQVVEATGPGGAVVNFTPAPSASDAGDASPVISCNHNSGDTFSLGDTTVICTATDASHNSSQGSFTVTVRDTTAPKVTVPNDITVEATGATGASVTFDSSAADAVDGVVATVCSPASGTTFGIGTTAVECSATDTHNNTAHKTFEVIVVDTKPPVLSLPGDMVVEAVGSSGTPVSFTASASDQVDGTTAVVCTPSSGATIAVGKTAVSCSSTDAHGNTATGSFNITVRDTTAPVITNVPSNMTVEATGPNGAAASWASPSASDTVDGAVAVSCAPASGSVFAIGTTTVTCSATDAHNNSSQRSFSVTVQDTTRPTATITMPAASGFYLLNQQVAAGYSCSDGGAGILSCIGTVNSGGNIDTSSVGVKSFTVTATDKSGNTFTQTVNYTVGYGVRLLYDATKAAKAGSTIPVKIQLTDATGVPNLSSAAVIPQAILVTRVSNNASTAVQDAGNANPDMNFRYDASLAGYIFNLKTTGLTTGSYVLGFRVGADPYVYAAPFQIR
jgi:DNA/RNA endonuclease G (NUC1)